MEHVKDCEAHFVFLTETWLTSQNNDVTAIIKSHGYKLYHHVRDNPLKQSGGGVAILYLDKYKLKKNYYINVCFF